MELRFEFAHQPVASEQEGFFIFLSAQVEAVPPRPKVLWARKVEIELALSTTGPSEANLSNSYNIIL